MNVTMPAPAPTAPPATAPSDRVAARERTTTTPSERRADDERTFEEQLDEVAVALASTRQPDRSEAHTEPHPTRGRTAIVPTAVAAPPASTPPKAAGETPAEAAVATPPVAIAAPVFTEIEGPHALLAAAPTTQAASALAAPADGALPTDTPTLVTTDATAAGIVPSTTTDAPTPAPTDPTATGIVPTTTTDAPTPAPTDPTATGIVPTTTTDAPTPAPTDPTATGIVPTTPTTESVTTPDADASPPLTLTTPADIGPIATSAASDGGADPAPAQTSLGAASKLALDAAVDASADAKADTVAGIESADSADATTPPVFVNPASSGRRADASATPASGPAPVLTEAADNLAPPMRLAPPRTIAVDLNDEGLGPLRVVATTEQRTVHLTVSAGEAIVRDALVRQQADLRNDLADAGLQLGSFEVDARAADRDHTDQPVVTSDSDRDRQDTRSAARRAATAPTRDTHHADGHLDLRL